MHKNMLSREVIVDLEARVADWNIADGKRVTGWTFNGQVPGPTIEANVGDTVVVRMTNSLPEATTLHWHGLRIPASMDGTSVVQRPIAPGETFEYRLPLLDAGTFWYHSHTNETVQVERGLYGAFIVRDENEPIVDNERVLVLDDVKLNRKGEMASFGGVLERHNGREGNVCVVNGRESPTIELAAGQVERWRIVNTSNARYMSVSLGDRSFQMIATSGGLLEAPIPSTSVLLAPGDRVDLAVGPFEEGDTFEMESLPYNRHAGRTTAARLASVKVGAPRESRASFTLPLREIVPLAPFDAQPTRQVRFGERLSLRHGMDFLINSQSHYADAPVVVGELQIWELHNTSHMDHPFHLHGFFFQVLSVNGAAPAYRSWEDTLNLPPRSRAVIAWMPDDRPGMWMYHCHILEHHAAGMMANFAVVRAPEDAHAMMEHGMSCHT